MRDGLRVGSRGDAEKSGEGRGKGSRLCHPREGDAKAGIQGTGSGGNGQDRSAGARLGSEAPKSVRLRPVVRGYEGGLAGAASKMRLGVGLTSRALGFGHRLRGEPRLRGDLRLRCELLLRLWLRLDLRP